MSTSGPVLLPRGEHRYRHAGHFLALTRTHRVRVFRHSGRGRAARHARAVLDSAVGDAQTGMRWHGLDYRYVELRVWHDGAVTVEAADWRDDP